MMKHHLCKSEIQWKSREDESILIQKLFFKKNGDLKTISDFNKNFKNDSDHQIISKLTTNIYTKHYSYLLFYHWYERKYRLNIIEDFSNSILTSPITDNSIIPSVYTRNQKLGDEVRNLVIKNIGSSKFRGFSVFYEYYHDFFPRIEEFSLNDLLGDKFLIYLLDLFPHIKQVIHGNGSYYRFLDKDLPTPKFLFEQEYGNVELRYNKGLPSFYPRVIGKEFTYTPLSLMNKTLRELENIVRESKDLPKIGEGWISETTLFYELKSYFKNEEVEHHGQPPWLGSQHVDIWFPKYNLGVEYQGLQHDQPVEYFGGETSFIKNKERDLRKKLLFDQNNSVLIEVRPGYKISEIIRKIENIIKRINTRN